MEDEIPNINARFGHLGREVGGGGPKTYAKRFEEAIS